MAIQFDCSQNGNVVIIEGITCNCFNENHKKDICDTIRMMNYDESICIERKAMNNQNLPAYAWSIVPLINGISIINSANVAVTIFAQPSELPVIHQIFQRQINAGIAWCTH